MLEDVGREIGLMRERVCVRFRLKGCAALARNFTDAELSIEALFHEWQT